MEVGMWLRNQFIDEERKKEGKTSESERFN